MTTFGSQQIVHVSVTEDLNTRDRYNKPATVRTETPVYGCRFRQLKSEEVEKLGTVATEVWKLTAPPATALLTATADDEIKYDGTTYQLVGAPIVKRDASGPHHVTAFCERVSA